MPPLSIPGVSRPSFLALTALLFAWTPVQAQDNPKLAVIERLGGLNGIALHCKALAETRRMKRALVLNLPKRRQLGELFDRETNRSFMNLIQTNGSCPSAATLQQQVDTAISALEEVYGDVQSD